MALPSQRNRLVVFTAASAVALSACGTNSSSIDPTPRLPTVDQERAVIYRNVVLRVYDDSGAPARTLVVTDKQGDGTKYGIASAKFDGRSWVLTNPSAYVDPSGQFGKSLIGSLPYEKASANTPYAVVDRASALPLFLFSTVKGKDNTVVLSDIRDVKREEADGTKFQFATATIGMATLMSSIEAQLHGNTLE